MRVTEKGQGVAHAAGVTDPGPRRVCQPWGLGCGGNGHGGQLGDHVCLAEGLGQEVARNGKPAYPCDVWRKNPMKTGPHVQIAGRKQTLQEEESIKKPAFRKS